MSCSQFFVLSSSSDLPNMLGYIQKSLTEALDSSTSSSKTADVILTPSFVSTPRQQEKNNDQVERVTFYCFLLL
jgi:hypothetical protein